MRGSIMKIFEQYQYTPTNKVTVETKELLRVLAKSEITLLKGEQVTIEGNDRYVKVKDTPHEVDYVLPNNTHITITSRDTVDDNVKTTLDLINVKSRTVLPLSPPEASLLRDIDTSYKEELIALNNRLEDERIARAKLYQEKVKDYGIEDRMKRIAEINPAAAYTKIKRSTK